ncbi:MAG: hypothetical protein QOG80_2587, partial [Pseudonocardiales bacterium]|nr:hypothetical protein [Pseudonocardiales bacterium]
MRSRIAALAAVGFAIVAGPVAAGAAVPTASLTFVESIPADHISTTTTTDANVTVGVQILVTCAVHSDGPDTVTNIAMRVLARTNDPAAWQVLLSPTGPKVPQDVGIGTVQPGQT